jgi:predicted nucleotidyltransferase
MGHLGVDRDRLDGFLKRVQARFPLHRAILVGSRARGDELVESDYDLVLVSPAFAGLSWRERIAAVLELWDMEVDLQPLCYTPEEYARKVAEISSVAEATREGLVLPVP